MEKRISIDTLHYNFNTFNILFPVKCIPNKCILNMYEVIKYKISDKHEKHPLFTPKNKYESATDLLLNIINLIIYLIT